MKFYLLNMEFEPIEECKYTVIGGYRLYAWILEEIRRRRPALSEKIHSDRMKKIALTPLSLRDGRYRMRLTFTDEYVSRRVAQIFLKSPILLLGDQKLRIKAIRSSVVNVTLDECRPLKSFLLKFLSPTLFRRGSNRDYLLPEPRVIVRSSLLLAERIAGLKPIGTEEEVAEERINIAMYDLRTVRAGAITSKGIVLRGFMGWCKYDVNTSGLTEENLECLRNIDFSLRVAELMNLGARRAMGFGHIEYHRVPLKIPLED